MAIGATAHKMVLDSTKFVEGASLSRKELKFLRQTLQETATDTEKFGAGMDKLANLQKRGALTTEQYERAVAKLRGEFVPAADVQQSWLDKLAPTIDVVNLASKAFHLLSSAVHGLTNVVRDQLQDIDKLVASSEKLGISTESFQNIATAAKFADVEVSAASHAVEKMLVAISKGEDGQKKFADTFKMLGLDAEKLQQMRPDQALGKILDALRGIGNQADKVRIATQLFGDADVLRMTSRGIQEASEKLEEFGGHLKDLDVERFKLLDDELESVNTNLDSMKKRFTMDLTPAISSAAAIMEGFMKSATSKGGAVEAIGEGAALTGIPFGKVTAALGGFGRVGAEGLSAKQRAKGLDDQLDARSKIKAEEQIHDSTFAFHDTRAMGFDSSELQKDQKREEMKMEKFLSMLERDRDETRIKALREQQRLKEAILRASKAEIDVIRQGSREAFQIQGAAAAFGNRAQVEEVTLL